VVDVVVSGNHRVELDFRLIRVVAVCEGHVILEKLPINKVSGVLPTILVGANVASIDHNVVAIRSDNEEAVSLADINNINLKKRLTAEVAVVYPVLHTARADALHVLLTI